jgi:FKBP-type peptidyl-prolyl cis-trans isomerase SlyD
MNTEENLTVAEDTVVGLDFTLRLDDGQVVGSSEEAEPLQFLQGHGQIIPGLETALTGMELGQEKDVVVEPDEGYGERNPEALQLVPKDAFPADVELSPGMGLQMRDQEGRVFQAYVVDIRDDGVVLDFNHPLAGKTLHFHVKVVELREATDEELEHGHVHGEDAHAE